MPRPSCSPPAANRCRRPAATAPASRSRGGSATPSCRPTPALAPLLLDDDTAVRIHRESVGRRRTTSSWRSGSTARSSTRLRGAMLWTHFGVSGPVALNASRHWLRARARGTRRCASRVNFCPGSTFDDVDARLDAHAAARPRASVQTVLGSRRCPRRGRGRRLRASRRSIAARRSRISRATTAGARRTRSSSGRCRSPASRGYNYAEATAGGVALDRDRSGDDGVADLPGAVPGRRNARRRRPDRRLQLPVGVVERVRRRPRHRRQPI